MKRNIDQGKTQSKSSAELPAPIRQVKDTVFNMLLKQLGDMFASCDDLFFNLSGRAKSNAEQNLYFESMREVRLKKGGLTANFKRNIDQQYHALMLAYDPPPQQNTDLSLNGLSLVENDQLEQKVAISAMVSKVRSNCQEALYFLNCRFDYLIQHKTVNEKNNPLDPENICSAFAEASEFLDLNIKARIILFKQFDRYVVNALPKIYVQANQPLINANVLPDLKVSVKKQRSAQSRVGSGPAHSSTESGHIGSGNTMAAAPSAAYASPGYAGGEQGQGGQQAYAGQSGAATAHAGLHELTSLFNNLRDMGIRTPSFIAFVPDYDHNAPTISRQALLNSLSGLNLNAGASLDAGPESSANANDWSASDQQGYIDIRAAIKNILLHNKESGAPKSIHPLDEDAINLVAMFFDFVLDDENIPVQIQALIGRLQIPVLKTALHDRTFFSDLDHPLRILVNKIADSCIGWSEIDKHNQDNLFEKIAEVVKAILDHDGEEREFYTTLLTSFDEYVSQEKRKSSLIEKRVSQVAIGKARSNHVRQQVQELLDVRLNGKQLPGSIYSFINDHWQNVLFLINLRDGVESAKWLDAVQVVDDLIWSIQPHDDEKSKQRLKHLLPNLYKNIANLLPLATTSQAEAQNILEDVEAVLEMIQANQTNELDYREYTSHAANSKPTETANRAEDEQTDTQAEPASDGQARLTAVQQQQAHSKKLQYAYIKMAEEMALGSWVEFCEDGKSQRFKLTAKVEESDSYIFVNRYGSKILEKNRKQFASALSSKNARVLNDTPLFNRAISHITENLTRLKSTAK